MNLKMALIHLYPRRWRDRYEEEFAALLTDCAFSPLDVLDTVLGALDAHLNFSLDNERMFLMVSRLQKFTLTMWWAWAVYLIAGMGFYGTLDDNPLTALGKTSAAGSLGVAVIVVQVGAVLTLLVMAAGGLPIALGVFRRALTGKRDVLALLAVPPLSLIAVVAYALIVLPRFTPIFVGDPATGFSQQAGTVAAYFGLVALIHVGELASAAAVAAAIARSSLDESAFRLARSVFRLAALPMLLTLAGIVVWGVIAYTGQPTLFSRALGLYGMSTALSWALVIGLMGAATIFAAVTALRGSPVEPVASGA